MFCVQNLENYVINFRGAHNFDTDFRAFLSLCAKINTNKLNVVNKNIKSVTNPVDSLRKISKKVVTIKL